MTEYQMVWSKMQGSVHLLASSNELDIFYLRFISRYSLIIECAKSRTFAMRVLSMAKLPQVHGDYLILNEELHVFHLHQNLHL